jgi:thioesterase domain-containing protein/acyl carrier protein
VEYLGRLDAQVKIRGFRIEPGEVEAVLLGLPQVREAAVAVREDEPGNRRLVAYVVPSDGAEVTGAGLRDGLRARLPEYMVPAAFVTLERLPLNANGKVDRRALPRPEAGGTGVDAYVAPRDELEATITGIFQEVLGVPRVGLTDSFFDLGGHSLLAMQLMARLEKATGVRIPVASLFRSPTVEQLANEVRSGGGETSLLVPIRPEGTRTPLFLVHPGGGNLLAYATLVGMLGEEQPVYGLRSRGIEPGEKPNWTVEEMARDYLAAIREVRPTGPYRLAGWSLGGMIAFEMARLLEAEGERVEKLVLIDSKAPRLHGPNQSMPVNGAQLVLGFAQDLGLPLNLLPAPKEETDSAGELVYLRELLESARTQGLLPADVEVAHIQHLYGVFRINLQAMFDYQPGSYAGHVTLLRAGKRKLLDRFVEKATVGWERVVRGGVEVRMIPGDHYSILRKPGVEKLASEMERVLG